MDTLPLFNIGALVYAERDDNILLVRAPGSSFFLRPGGVLEGDEAPQQTALRELHEETGLEPTGPLRLVGVHRIVRGTQKLINLSFACECGRGDVRLSDEHEDFAWIQPSAYRRRIAAALAVLPDGNLKAVTESILADLDEYLASI